MSQVRKFPSPCRTYPRFGDDYEDADSQICLKNGVWCSVSHISLKMECHGSIPAAQCFLHRRVDATAMVLRVLFLSTQSAYSK